jgi:hypothetical protein
MEPDASAGAPIRVLHFVTGGFSGGATQVAIALVNAARGSGRIEPLLVLRRKRRGDPKRIAELEQAGVPLAVVPGWSHAASIAALVRVCREFRPEVLVALGFSEHLWGRYAGLLDSNCRGAVAWKSTAQRRRFEQRRALTHSGGVCGRSAICGLASVRASGAHHRGSVGIKALRVCGNRYNAHARSG